MDHPLNDPVRSALTGPHAHLARRRGNVLYYPTRANQYLCLPDPPGAEDWADVAALVHTERSAFAWQGSPDGMTPAWWADRGLVLNRHPGLLMVADTVDAVPDHEAVRLGTSDLPDIEEFVARNRHGRQFRPDALDVGTFLGIRRSGELVAMAGERLRPAGWTEISGVCTDSAHRGQGLATRLTRALVAGVRRRGEGTFLLVDEVNTGAIRLYEHLGFQLHRRVEFDSARLPA
jgi:ribosomal protein S18 acetylase RimI-like enzyme